MFLITTLIAALIVINLPWGKGKKKRNRSKDKLSPQTWADYFREDIHERNLKI